MYSTFPVLYDSNLSIQDLGRLPSSAREWANVKQDELNRGLWEPERKDNASYAVGDVSTITLNNSGIANQDDIFKGLVRKPSQYQQTTDLQAYIQLYRDADREPTAEEILEAQSDDVDIDARFINLINRQEEGSNVYANKSQNFQRTLQQSVNNYYKEENKYKVPMELDEGLPSLFDLATLEGRKKIAKEALSPLAEFRKRFREMASAGKVGANAIKGLAIATGLSGVAAGAEIVSQALSAGLSVDSFLSGLEANPDRSMQDLINLLQPPSA